MKKIINIDNKEREGGNRSLRKSNISRYKKKRTATLILPLERKHSHHFQRLEWRPKTGNLASKF